MNKQHVKGAVNELKGKAKENIGHLTGDDKMAGEGVFDRVKGKIQKGLGDLKDALKRSTDEALSDKE